MSSSAHSSDHGDPVLPGRDIRPRRTLSLGVLLLGLFAVQVVIVGAAVLVSDLPV